MDKYRLIIIFLTYTYSPSPSPTSSTPLPTPSAPIPTSSTPFSSVHLPTYSAQHNEPILLLFQPPSLTRSASLPVGRRSLCGGHCRHCCGCCDAADHRRAAVVVERPQEASSTCSKYSRARSMSGAQCTEYSLEEVLKATSNWSSDNQLGSGAFGDIYKGVCPHDGTTLWAVKRAKLIDVEFHKEVGPTESARLYL
ncbi:unnamed protein product [Closterium sp. NIES-53]